ncbi:hypothetical protein AMECASPLE_002691 [Ameca splendens]|uniref:Uncharacterized protein n=1 Tax=Ameca splendens TaxID=208324 RepID=A0ABV0XMD1_9TELE
MPAFHSAGGNMRERERNFAGKTFTASAEWTFSYSHTDTINLCVSCSLPHQESIEDIYTHTSKHSEASRMCFSLSSAASSLPWRQNSHLNIFIIRQSQKFFQKGHPFMPSNPPAYSFFRCISG